MLFGHVRLAVFFRALWKYFFGQGWLNLLEKIGPYAYGCGSFFLLYTML